MKGEIRNASAVRRRQDYDAMVKLVQTLEMLPTCDLATQPMIQFHYAFALNRWVHTEAWRRKEAFTPTAMSASDN